MKTLVYIEFNAEDVYVEYENKDSEHVSYTRAKTLLKSTETTIRYSEPSSQRGCDFINSLSRKSFMVTATNIYPKVPISNFVGGKGILK